MSVLEAVKKGLQDGTIEVIASDHAPHLLVEKFREFAKLVQTGALQLPPPVMNKVVLHLMDE